VTTVLDRSDLRIAVPVAGAWIVAAVLVGSPSRAPAVVGVAAVVVAGCAGALWWSRVHGAGRVVVVFALTGAAFAGVVGVAVHVGDARRTPAVLGPVVRGSVVVEVVLDRDLGSGDRSVLGTLVSVGGAEGAGRAGDASTAGGVGTVRAAGTVAGTATGAVAGLRVPVRVVPDRDGGVGALGAGTRLTGRAAVEPDEPGSATAYVLFVRGDVATSPPTGFLAATGHARRAFAGVTSALPEPGGSLLRGLAIGDRSGLDPGTEAAMETSALTHLTAVSGSNCAVIVALVVLIGRGIGLGRVVRAVLAITLLLGFVVLVRPDPSILRATVMAVVVLVVHLAGRPVRGVPLIGVAVLGMLVVDPWFARSFAFGLSVLATSGIVVLAPPLTAVLARRCPTPVAAAVAVPVAAQVACWPLTIPLSAALPTYAVPANLLAEPFAPVVTVVGLVACVLAPVWPAGASVVASVAWVPASAIGAIAHGAAGLPAASVPWPVGAVGIVAAVAVCSAVAVAVLVSGPVRLHLLIAAGVVVVIGAAVTLVPIAVVRAQLPTDWGVAACDVGQGDAVLVRSGGRTAGRRGRRPRAAPCVPRPARGRPGGPPRADALRPGPRRRRGRGRGRGRRGTHRTGRTPRRRRGRARAGDSRCRRPSRRRRDGRHARRHPVADPLAADR
jgi:competence protein ComEC